LAEDWKCILNALLKAERISATELSRASILTASGLPRTRISASAGVVAAAKAPPTKIAARIPKLGERMMRTGAIAKLVTANLLQLPAILLQPLNLPLSNTRPAHLWCRISRGTRFMKVMKAAAAASFNPGSPSHSIRAHRRMPLA
jgi:hypothetical protein